MRTLFILATFLFSVSGISQTKYEQGMQKAFDLWKNEKPMEAANLFERIAQAETDNWLPLYYVAKINIIYSFGEKDATKFSAQLEKARDFINDATAISKDNPEILILDALWYTAWIAYDGQKYGMTYSGKVTSLYEKAIQLAPKNPRVVLGKAEWEMEAAQYFGKPITPYCKDVARALSLFATFKPESDFHPNDGEGRAKELLNNSCRKK
ncbi:tetratricopeptide repeat protein [Cochleicola gelatinilyticus]|uniref:Tetratricopeptide repeat protein n=1 Tax=Cochleicola gelatinilyticus TaxID=1763537 RepID=A0A167HQS8_9FLAO|nr:hypothetical protein [Cochleicola gelatinilyticus]OAB78868.1 hypothetical protein ULVI_09815 [Cochleicola gelatinilyticus]